MVYAIIIIIFLIIIIIKLNIKIHSICEVLQEFHEGNLNVRVRMQTCNKNLQNLSEHINDLTDKFQEETKLNKNYEFQRKKMITNISHDLRTPLTSLLGYIEFIKNNKNLSQEEIEEYINIVQDKGNSLRNLINKFFYLSKLETTDIRLKREKLNLSELIRKNIILFYNDFNNKNVIPIIKMPKEDVYIFGDQDAMERILNNLISNVVKYGCDGINIGVNLISNEKSIKIVVWDEGKGISKENLPLIFERLYTGDKSRNKTCKGSGIGLTIVKKLVEMQKGNIKVQSIPNKKTKFIVTLPNI